MTVLRSQGLVQMLTSTMQRHMAVAPLGLFSKATPVDWPFTPKYFASWLSLGFFLHWQLRSGQPSVRAHRQKLPKMILFSPLGHGLVNQSPPVPLHSPHRCFQQRWKAHAASSWWSSKTNRGEEEQWWPKMSRMWLPSTARLHLRPCRRPKSTYYICQMFSIHICSCSSMFVTQQWWPPVVISPLFMTQ